jgi:hypothetical protein
VLPDYLQPDPFDLRPPVAVPFQTLGRDAP